MRLYQLLISIFCVRILGFINYVSLIFCIMFFRHIEYRLPDLLKQNQNNKYLHYLNESFEIKKRIANNNTNNTVYFYIISSNIAIPIINIYYSIECYYLIFLNEIIMMFSNMIMGCVTTLLSTSIKSPEINYKQEITSPNIRILNKLDSDSDSDTDTGSDECVMIQEPSLSTNDILYRIKQNNNINDKQNEPSFLLKNLLNNKKFNSMNINDLNNVNSNLLSMTNLLNGVVNSIENKKMK